MTLADKIATLEPDALRVIETIVDRLIMGRAVYGSLVIESDRRNWRREAHEEALDMAVYLAVDTLRSRT
jgi:hypothetical protein